MEDVNYGKSKSWRSWLRHHWPASGRRRGDAGRHGAGGHCRPGPYPGHPGAAGERYDRGQRRQIRSIPGGRRGQGEV